MMSTLETVIQWLLQNHLPLYLLVVLMWFWFLRLIATIHSTRQNVRLQLSNNDVRLKELRVEELRVVAQCAAKGSTV